MNPARRALLEDGIGQFNAQRYFEAHETWEQAWLQSSGEEKVLLQGLIQAAAAYVKWQRKEPRGAFRLSSTAIEKLYSLEETEHCGVEVAALIDALVKLRERAGAAVAGSTTPADAFEPPKLGYTPGADDADRMGSFSVFAGVRCPYCGEEVEVTVEAVGASAESFVQDCSVCCRPWNVHVSRDGEEVDVSLSRDDE